MDTRFLQGDEKSVTYGHMRDVSSAPTMRPWQKLLGRELATARRLAQHSQPSLATAIRERFPERQRKAEVKGPPTQTISRLERGEGVNTNFIAQYADVVGAALFINVFVKDEQGLLTSAESIMRAAGDDSELEKYLLDADVAKHHKSATEVEGVHVGADQGMFQSIVQWWNEVDTDTRSAMQEQVKRLWQAHRRQGASLDPAVGNHPKE